MSERPAAAALEVLGLVDLHWSGKRELRLPDLSGVDLVLLGGDLTHFRGIEVAEALIDQISASGARVLAVCGNCDQPEIESLLKRRQIALDGTACRVGGVGFVGVSAGLPFGGCPYERTEKEFAAACERAWRADLELPAADVTVMVSHQPPHDCNCDLSRGRHVGSSAIRSSILEHQPNLVFCGHIHEAAGTDRLGDSLVVNPGPWFAGGALRFKVTATGIDILT